MRRIPPAGVLFALLLITATGALRLASQAQPSPAKPQAKAAADPHAAIRANNLGAAYMNQQRMEQALGEFQRAAALDPQLAVARLNQGIALLNLQRTEAARAILREAAERDAKSIRAWYNLGLLEKNAGDAEAALAAFEKAAALDPADADTQYFIGTLHAQQNRYPEAIAAFQQAIALNRFHVSAEFGLARALQRTGDVEKARAHLHRFQHLNTAKLGAPMSLAYGDQGFYSLAESVSLPASAAPPPIPVQFVVAEAAASAGPRPVRGESVTAEVLGDYDNDGLTDRAVIAGEKLVLLRSEGAGEERDVTEAAGIRRDIVRGRLLFFDFDHDGDLDLYVTGCLIRAGETARSSGAEDSMREHTLVRNVLWRNNGNGTFTDWSEEAGLDDPLFGFLATATDWDNDRAIDLVLAGTLPAASVKRPASTGPLGPTILHNQREGPFQAKRTAHRELPTAEVAAVLAKDMNRDGWMDLAFAHRSPPGITLWPGTPGKENVQPQAIAVPNIGWATHLVSLDADNDGWLDLAALTEEAGQVRLVILRNEGGQSFREVTRVAGIGLEAGKGRWLAAADGDEDGDTDLLTGQQGGPTLLVRNDGGNKNNWLKLSLKGLADNKSAIGTKVEVFAGASYQKFEITTPNDLLIGLGQEKQADVVRLLWPTGVLQDEVNLAANQRHVITQIDRRGSSCPVLFAWNGERFEFIADAIGPGIVGHWVAPGVRNTSDPTEYLKVPGTLLRERRGANGERLLSFRFAEPMEEIVYLDQLRLLAIDHPADTDVNPSERFYASGPPFPTGEPVFTHRAHARPPAQAWNHRGQEVTALLRDRDRRYVSDFADAPYKGFAELHWIELELGDSVGTLLAAPSRGGPDFTGASRALPASAPLRLLLHGYTDYFTATSVYAAHQGGVTAMVPYVEAQLADGTWRRVVDDMGFPAGLARTMVADLTGKLPAGTRRIRIATNLKVYWDQILIDTTPAGTPHRITEAQLAAASAGYLGYPREIRGRPESDVRYDYHTVSATGPYARAAGHYTRYGDVRALVAQADDRFVIMGSGDEVAVDFDATALPPVPAGWRRNWFFYVDGFAKDMDFYAAHPFTTTPLPYHGMPGYPYPPERPYPDRGAHLEDQLELNTRAVSGRPPHTYRYAYPR